MIEGFGHSGIKTASTAEPSLREELTSIPAAPAIAPWVLRFVYRYDSHCGHVVHELPLLIPSIQIMLADDYYVRERDDDAPWSAAPRMGLWGPRVAWGYGYAKRVVRSFSFGLTPRGYDDLISRPIEPLIDRVVDLADVRPDLAAELRRIVSREGPDDWIRQTTAAVLRAIDTSASHASELDGSLHHLQGEEGDTVARASKAAGLGDRQYRRAFRSRYGLSPRLYRRVLRVDRLMRRLHPAPWDKDEHATDLAFADQPHMIREFKALTGVTPGEYVRSKRVHNDPTIRSVIATGIAPPIV